MRDFTFFNPTRIEFGKGKENQIGNYVREFNTGSALIIYGSERVRQNGLLDRVTSSLKLQGITYEAMGGVVSNPKLSFVKEAIRVVKERHFEAVVAVGGGSVLDSAKAIAAGAKYEGDVWDFFINKAVVQDAPSVFSIMTLAATGSEMNALGVVTNDETRQKYPIYSPLLYPKVSVINPDLMATVSNAYLAYSAADIFAHLLDLYFTADHLPKYNTGLIEVLLQRVKETTELLLKNPHDYDARGEFAWASTMALNGNTFVGVAGNSFDTHMVEHAMSALYNVAHGAGLAVVLPAWMRWYKKNRPERFERFAEQIFGVKGADKGIEKLRDWFVSIGAPVTLGDLGIPESGIDALADNAYDLAQNWNMAEAYSRDSIVSILKLALH